MVLPETLQRLINFMASPLGVLAVIAWMLASICSAYRFLKRKQGRENGDQD